AEARLRIARRTTRPYQVIRTRRTTKLVAVWQRARNTREEDKRSEARSGHASLKVDRFGGCRHGHIAVELGANTQLLFDLLLDFVGEVGVVAQVRTRVFLPLAQLVTIVGVPSAGLADDALLDADVDERT